MSASVRPKEEGMGPGLRVVVRCDPIALDYVGFSGLVRGQYCERGAL